MTKHLIVSAVLGFLALGSAVSAAQAVPALATKPAATDANSAVQNIWWRRVCDRDGDRCHRVWVRPHWFRDLRR